MADKYDVDHQQFADLLASLPSLSQVMLALGKSRHNSHFRGYLRELAVELNLEIPDGKYVSKGYRPLDEWMQEGTRPSSAFKRRLLREGYLLNNCYVCGIGPEWCGKSMSLHLDHINGINTDNRLSNLRMLCPNCHSQTPTYCAKNSRK